MAGLDKALYNFIRRRQIPGLEMGQVYADSQGVLSAFDVGKTYFVAGNYGLDTNDGSSWKRAFKTLAAAITANNTDIAADKYGWAARNRIFISGDTFAESLVAFPNKCDVIGVGSYDANPMPGITGQHAPVNTGNMGTRWFNVRFVSPATAAPLITLVNSTSGFEAYDCILDGTAGTVTTGITATAAPFFKVIGCKFLGAFATSCIAFGTGAMLDVEIKDNIMSGSAGTGIVMHSGTTCARNGIVQNNYINSTGVCINDASSKFALIGNRCITANAKGTSGAGAIIGGAYMMQDNRISCSDLANGVLPAQGGL